MGAQTAVEVMDIYLHQVLGERRFDLIPDIAASGMVDSTQPGKTGPEALDAHARGFCGNIPNLEIEVLQVFGDSNHAVGVWRWHGTPRQPSTVSAKGTPVSPRLICSVFEVEDGQILDYRAFVDAVDVFVQLAQ